MGSILQEGGSWSGHEKNCCFLNTRSSSFADVSSAIGFDSSSDSRALGVVDWDQDGDLDVWCVNRTAPRILYYQNNAETLNKNRFLAFKLRGTKSNRDAIGTRVELQSADGQGEIRSSIQTLRAGEGYLSQASKWLHFGLGSDEPQVLIVRWPNGEEQAFADLEPNTRYLIDEGNDSLTSAKTRIVDLPVATAMTPTIEPESRIVAARRIPMPKLSHFDGAGNSQRMSLASEKMTLLTVWASWCKPCLEELQELEGDKQQLHGAGIRWLPVNFEEPDFQERKQTVAGVLAKLGVKTPSLLATRGGVENLDAMQKILVARQKPMPVPCSFFVDRRGELMVVYKGQVNATQVIADAKHLQAITLDPRDGTTPLPGKWAMNAFPPDLMALPNQLMKIGRDADALDYLTEHIPTTAPNPPITTEILSDTYLSLGLRFMDSRNVHNAQIAFEYAVKADETSWRAQMGLADILLGQRKTSDAVRHYREILELAENQPMTLNNLAWLLATTADESVRSPAEALQLAEKLCELTKHSEPSSLDTLSVALAANGQFDKAVETLQQALELAKKIGKPTEKMQGRLELYKRGKSYRETF